MKNLEMKKRFQNLRQTADKSQPLTDAIMAGLPGAPATGWQVIRQRVLANGYRAITVFAVCLLIGSLLSLVAQRFDGLVSFDNLPHLHSLSNSVFHADSDLELPDDESATIPICEILARAVLPLSFHLLAGWFLLMTVGISLPSQVSHEKEISQ